MKKIVKNCFNKNMKTIFKVAEKSESALLRKLVPSENYYSGQNYYYDPQQVKNHAATYHKLSQNFSPFYSLVSFRQPRVSKKWNWKPRI